MLCDVYSQELKPITLNPPDTKRGSPVMQALALRASHREFLEKKLDLRDLSDLLWAANGINRPENGKRTAPSAMNAQDVDVYAFTEEGIYLYDAAKHTLNPVAAGDQRSLFAGRQPSATSPPVILVMVSDISRFRPSPDSLKLVWAAMDVGTVSQNISLFCAGIGLSTVPRAGMNQAKLREVMKLKETQHIMLNNPVGYPKK
jgi:SagB-type dehydrogenase family enzyme